MKVGIIYHNDFKKYDFGPGHPFRGSCFNDESAFSLVKNNFEINKKAEIRFIEPTAVGDEEILTVHTEEYLEFIKTLNQKGGYLTPDTPVLQGMYDTAKLFAGANILAGRMVMDRSVDKSLVFGMIGHHAGADFGGGFCLINDIAVMIKVLQREYDLKKVMILDYSSNTGHGTTRIFYDSSEVLCIDIHQDPLTLYPGTGFSEQVGRGDGIGYTINIPLPPLIQDRSFVSAVKEIVVPIAKAYNPELIVAVGLSNGHYSQQMNQFMLTLHSVKETVGTCSQLSDELCSGRFVHIGGFSIEPELLAQSFMSTMAGTVTVDVEYDEPNNIPGDLPDVTEDADVIIETVKDIHNKYWKVF
jgi:acetoin utilization protein AcuC